MLNICSVNLTKAKNLLTVDRDNEEKIRKEDEENLNEYLKKVREKEKEKEEEEEKKKQKRINRTR